MPDFWSEVAQEPVKTDVTVPATNSPKNLSAGARAPAQKLQDTLNVSLDVICMWQHRSFCSPGIES